VAGILVCLAFAAAQTALPDGFTETRLAEGLTGATALAVAPDGRIFACEQTGALRVIKNDALLPEPFVRLRVDSFWERGLIGVALDPAFPDKPYVYVTSVSPDPVPHHVVSRFTARGDAAEPGSEVVLLEGDDQTKLGGSIPAGHQGGALHFGRDGKLYVGIGEQTAGAPAQDLDTFLGKLLRINPDGSVPEDNPFFSKARGKYRAIWAVGLRNPFCFAVHPKTGRIFINDVGGSLWEEVNEGVAGANYGWPRVEGPSKDPAFRAPLHAYPRGVGKSITGGVFYAATQFPEEYRGRYFFMDYEANWIRTLDPDSPGKSSVFATGLVRPVDLRVAPDGSLVVLHRNAWVKDKKFAPNTGFVTRIRYAPGSARPSARAEAPPGRAAEPPRLRLVPAGGRFGGPVTVTVLAPDGADVRVTTDGREPGPGSPPYRGPFALRASTVVKAKDLAGGAADAASYAIEGNVPYGMAFRETVTGLNLGRDAERLPRRLSETALFRSLPALQPAPGLVPYDVNVPQWADGASKRRWIALPGRQRIRFSEKGDWGFPEGTVLVEHLDLEGPRETRVLVVDRSGGGFGAAYRWRADGSDADLVEEGGEVEIALKGGRKKWITLGPLECLSCHSPPAGFVLGVNARQLQRRFPYGGGVVDGQLRTWNYLEMFEGRLKEQDLANVGRLVPMDEAAAPLEARVRSYLDANCASCHRPGGPGRGLLDARFETPLRDQHLVDAPLLTGDLGIPGARNVAPGDLRRSVLYERMKRRGDPFKMPPLGSSEPHEEALRLLADWIRMTK
jgi:glucose/arabinose dehydrogenase